MAQDNIQHGIDDNPTGDAEKGAALGGLGGVAVGAAAGSVAGPVGTVVGAIAGGLLGAGASGAAVAAVDAVDNDNTVTGVGSTTSHPTEHHHAGYGSGVQANTVGADVPVGGHNVVTGDEAHTDAGKSGLASGAIVGGLIGTAVGGPVGAVVGGTLGSLTGGVAGDAAEAADEENIAERNNYSGDAFRSGTNLSNGQGDTSRSVSDAFRNDENIGLNNVGAADLNADTNQVPVRGGVRSDDLPGNDIPGIQTGGLTTQGSDTRGISEKAADAITGDRYDDKTGGRSV